jgi:hypothetical protein
MRKVSFDCPDELLNWLDSINPVRSKAILTVLKSVKKGYDQTERKQILDNSIMWSCFGAIFLFINYIIPIETRIFAIIIGIFLFSYGAIGGVYNALSRTNNNR